MLNRIHHFYNRNLGLIVVTVVSFIIISIFYSPILFHPQKYILSDVGDGIKNYYCFEWHVHNDDSFVNYSGSNYPFGENHGYTDGNPLLSNILRILPYVNNTSIAIFNLSLLLSLVLCSLILFKLFKKFNVPDLYAVIASVGLSFLCPQVFRLTGHFTLSYGFCIPLIIYLLFKYEENRERRLYSVMISFSTLAIFFIHPYLGMIITSFLLFYWVIKCCTENKKIRQNLFELLSQALLPLIVYFLYTKILDTHADRVAKPYGFFHSNSSIETIFISTDKPFRHFLSMIYKIKSQNYEGVAYVGITSVFFMFYVTFQAIRKRKKIWPYINNHPKAKTFLWMAMSSIILLLFSMGYPFKLNMNWILDYIPVLQQFRIPGRFAWVFYFVSTIAVTIFITKFFLPKANKTFRTLLSTALLGLFIFEAIPFHKSISKKPFPKDCFEEEYVDNELKALINIARTKNPVAIIPLPFFHIGTDYFNIAGTDKIIKASLITCYHSKTPLMASLTPRNSLTEAENLIQIVSNDLIERDIKNKVPQGKPLLIIYSKEKLSSEESTLFARGRKLLETSNYIMKEITHTELFSNSIVQQQADFKKKRHNLFRKGEFFLSVDNYFYFADFDSCKGKVFQGNAVGINNVLEIKANSIEKDKTYQLSFWYQTRDRLDLDNILSVKEIGVASDTTVLSSKNIKSMINIQNKKVLATLSFKTEHPENKILICLKGISDREKIFYLDDLMVRGEDCDSYRISYSPLHKDSVLKINNIDTFFKYDR